MIDIITSLQIEEIYAFNCNTLVDIAKFLNKWDDMSDSEKSELESDAKSVLEKKFGLDITKLTKQDFEFLLESEEFQSQYNDNLTYGEITKKGVFQLSEILKNFNGVFYDIGSGNGKLILHLSLISNFSKYVGIEICELRHLFAEKIKSKIESKVDLICDDVLNIDISDANLVLINDLMFTDDLKSDIHKKLPKDCFYITAFTNGDDEFIRTVDVCVSWWPVEFSFNLYKKK